MLFEHLKLLLHSGQRGVGGQRRARHPCFLIFAARLIINRAVCSPDRDGRENVEFGRCWNVHISSIAVLTVEQLVQVLRLDPAGIRQGYPSTEAVRDVTGENFDPDRTTFRAAE